MLESILDLRDESVSFGFSSVFYSSYGSSSNAIKEDDSDSALSDLGLSDASSLSYSSSSSSSTYDDFLAGEPMICSSSGSSSTSSASSSL